METLSIVLIIIGVVVLIFSIWGFLIIRKHISKYNANQRVSQSLNGEKYYYELKARQDYIVAVSAIILALFSVLGYTSLKEIKSQISSDIESDVNKQVSAKIKEVDSLSNDASLAFGGIKIEGKTLTDSMRSSLKFIVALSDKVAKIFEKEIIRQNLFIIDNLQIANFPINRYKGEDYRYIHFGNLRTVSGQKLPFFEESPSVIVFTTNGGEIAVEDITKEGLKVRPWRGLPISSEEERENPNSDHLNLKFSIWISQKGVYGK
jgi:hypothetical protein